MKKRKELANESYETFKQLISHLSTADLPVFVLSYVDDLPKAKKPATECLYCTPTPHARVIRVRRLCLSIENCE